MHIEEFLKTYDDQHLTMLLAAAQDGHVRYCYGSQCLLGRHQLRYDGVKSYDNPYRELASNAEIKYCYIAQTDWMRCQKLIPMIQAEITRREQLKQPAVVEKPAEVEELVCV